ncbi:D-alanyl-D-alanine carboxypeptidase/D-alanyl-D-alanine endopeptidase [Solwaraspora sp. WMMB335]|uniref:D-alanyl-D-alanine carboxypeptidase/D-alanyl-D-alanine endopeptidase n=1 Tax=Solwaraspora sp. WMMB335 TaxID=3404118 RepID=UPI003B960B3F
MAGSPADGSPPAAPPRRRRKLPLVVATIIGVLLVATGASVAVVRPGPVAGWLGAAPPPSPTPTPSAEPTPGPVLAGLAVDTPMPTAAGLSEALSEVLAGASLGPRTHVAVQDMVTGTVLFSQSPSAMTMPASTTKLVTAATALAAVGPAHRITTRVVAGSEPGEVVLIGGGDPTLTAGESGFYPGAARLDELAAATRTALGGSTPTRIILDVSLFSGPALGPGWDDDIPTGGYASAITALMIDGGRSDPAAGRGWAQRSAQPDLAAGRAFARALGLPAASVSTAPAGYVEQLASAPPQSEGSAGPAAAASPDSVQNPAAASARPGPSASAASPDAAVQPGSELARVASPPMIGLVEMMLADSDNVIAEAIARQVAIARGEPASFTGAAAAMDAVLLELGLPAEQSDLSDGSGLSRRNRLTPALLTELLVLAGSGSRPELTGLFSGLPVAAWSGTLQDRYQNTSDARRAGAGMVRAKTGSLSGVNALAGTVTTADGRLLAFAVLADSVPLYIDAAQAALDRIAATLARCGCR